MGWWDQLWTQRAQTWTYGYLDAAQVPDGLARAPIPADKFYVSVFLRSMRIVNVRQGLTKFYGTAHSFISVPHLSGKPAQFHVLTTPSNLRDIDAANVDRVINMNQRLLGPIPYRGGDVGLEVGLFSIKSADLAAPFLDVLQSMSKAAGVSYINAALPFVGPLLDGVKLLTGTQSDATLEIGVARTFQTLETGYLVVLRAPQGSLVLKDLRVGQDFQLLDAQGKVIGDYPYMVLATEAQPQRVDWFQIPEVSQAYNDLRAQANGPRPKPEAIREAFDYFKRVTQGSPDLLFDDADKIVTEVETRLQKQVGAFGPPTKAPGLPELREILIYG